MSGPSNRFKAHPGQRDAPAASMLMAAGLFTDCLSLVGTEAPAYPDVIRITGARADQANHAASPDPPGVKALAIRSAANRGQQTDSRSVIGLGLAS